MSVGSFEVEQKMFLSLSRGYTPEVKKYKGVIAAQHERRS